MNKDYISTCKAYLQRHFLYYLGLLLILFTLLTIAIVAYLNMMSISGLNIDKKEIASGVLLLDRCYKEPAAKFSVEPHTVSDLLAALKPYQIDQNPAKWMSLGVLEFELTNGKKHTVFLFDTDNEQAAFRIDSIYYRGGSNSKLKHIVGNLRKKAKEPKR